MTDPNRCGAAPLERIVEAGKHIAPLETWASEFERRYLDLSTTV